MTPTTIILGAIILALWIACAVFITSRFFSGTSDRQTRWGREALHGVERNNPPADKHGKKMPL